MESLSFIIGSSGRNGAAALFSSHACLKQAAHIEPGGMSSLGGPGLRLEESPASSAGAGALGCPGKTRAQWEVWRAVAVGGSCCPARSIACAIEAHIVTASPLSRRQAPRKALHRADCSHRGKRGRDRRAGQAKPLGRQVLLPVQLEWYGVGRLDGDLVLDRLLAESLEPGLLRAAERQRQQFGPGLLGVRSREA